MRILVLSQHFLPETVFINEVVESLRHAGCHVTVLTGQPKYPQGEVFMATVLAVSVNSSTKGNRPLEPQALEVEFFAMEEVLHEKVKIH